MIQVLYTHMLCENLKFFQKNKKEISYYDYSHPQYINIQQENEQMNERMDE